LHTQAVWIVTLGGTSTQQFIVACPGAFILSGDIAVIAD
jgi:hypothetical protein